MYKLSDEYRFILESRNFSKHYQRYFSTIQKGSYSMINRKLSGIDPQALQLRTKLAFEEFFSPIGNYLKIMDYKPPCKCSASNYSKLAINIWHAQLAPISSRILLGDMIDNISYLCCSGSLLPYYSLKYIYIYIKTKRKKKKLTTYYIGCSIVLVPANEWQDQFFAFWILEHCYEPIGSLLFYSYTICICPPWILFRFLGVLACPCRPCHITICYS